MCSCHNTQISCFGFFFLPLASSINNMYSLGYKNTRTNLFQLTTFLETKEEKEIKRNHLTINKSVNGLWSMEFLGWVVRFYLFIFISFFSFLGKCLICYCFDRSYFSVSIPSDNVSADLILDYRASFFVQIGCYFILINPVLRKSWISLKKWKRPQLRARSKQGKIITLQFPLLYMMIMTAIDILISLLFCGTRLLSNVETKPDPLLPM